MGGSVARYLQTPLLLHATHHTAGVYVLCCHFVDSQWVVCRVSKHIHLCNQQLRYFGNRVAADSRLCVVVDASRSTANLAYVPKALLQELCHAGGRAQQRVGKLQRHNAMVAAADEAHSILDVPLPAGVRHRVQRLWRDRSFVMWKCGLLLHSACDEQCASVRCLQLTAQKLAYRKLINFASRPEHRGWGIATQQLLDKHGVTAA